MEIGTEKFMTVGYVSMV